MASPNGQQARHEVTVNGTSCALDGTDPSTTALDWLRSIGLTGAKEGCAEGECGACSVMVARPDGDSGTQWTAINACLVPVAALDGGEVVTAEGLGTSEALHPVQQELAVRGGSQCGYCTPGFVCSMAAEFYRAGRCAPSGGRPGSVQRWFRRHPALARARPQRLRPARPQRQPVPVHGLPPDPGRGVCAG